MGAKRKDAAQKEESSEPLTNGEAVPENNTAKPAKKETKKAAASRQEAAMEAPNSSGNEKAAAAVDSAKDAIGQAAVAAVDSAKDAVGQAAATAADTDKAAVTKTSTQVMRGSSRSCSTPAAVWPISHSKRCRCMPATLRTSCLLTLVKMPSSCLRCRSRSRRSAVIVAKGFAAPLY